ncbi:MAG TPA: DUF4238 domain-containing protein [Candidatus Saccharimonadales bacterium]|nr:DUF4238 domain-containing protein [Candidatus Saccharimonadales bacterium]
MTKYKNNHYVPQWYQEGFIPSDEPVRNLQYLDLNPATFTKPDGRLIKDKDVRPWGPSKCFAEPDLYTRWFGAERNTQVEELFFGRIDAKARDSIKYFNEYDHTSIDYEALHNMLPYLGSQRLRTPRGLAWISAETGVTDKNQLMQAMASLRDIYSAVWAECIWQIADADNSETKLIISDNPVTVYNREIGTHNSTWHRDRSDPDITLFGSHTIFALTMNKVLILTHPGWAKSPYQNGMLRRPNIQPYRPTVFNYTQIQIDRHLTEEEVRQINFILKSKAQRYVAAYKKEWLYPEKHVDPRAWRDFGDGRLFLPDPRSLTTGTQYFVGFKDGRTYAQDEYGRLPTQDQPSQVELNTLHRIQGEFAHKYGPVRRGISFSMGELEEAVDSDSMHELYLSRYRPRGSEAKRLKLAMKAQRFKKGNTERNK